MQHPSHLASLPSPLLLCGVSFKSLWADLTGQEALEEVQG